MKYNYCPVCGEKLPPHHIGKMCRNCARKDFKKKVIAGTVILGVGAASAAAAYYYVRSHKEEVASAAKDLAELAVASEIKKLANDTGAVVDFARNVYRLAQKQPV